MSNAQVRLQLMLCGMDTFPGMRGASQSEWSGDFGWRSNRVLKVLVRFRADSPSAAMLGTILRNCLNRSLAAPQCRTLQ